MAKTIEFYIPQSFRKVSKWFPAAERGKVPAFPLAVRKSARPVLKRARLLIDGYVLQCPRLPQQFANPDTNFTSPTFGVISSTAVNARVGQLALRFTF